MAALRRRDGLESFQSKCGLYISARRQVYPHSRTTNFLFQKQGFQLYFLLFYITTHEEENIKIIFVLPVEK